MTDKHKHDADEKSAIGAFLIAIVLFYGVFIWWLW